MPFDPGTVVYGVLGGYISVGIPFVTVQLLLEDPKGGWISAICLSTADLGPKLSLGRGTGGWFLRGRATGCR